MVSLRARLFNWMMRMRFRSKPIHLVDPDVLRAQADSVAPRKPPAAVSVEAVDANGVKGEWHRFINAEPGRTILYLHGGGYVFGSPRSHCAFTYALARDAKAQVFSLDYRLAPEHRFPAAVDDSLASYEWLLAQGVNPAQLAVGGDSAGGGLTLALLSSIRARGMAMPAAAFLLSPWTDLAMTGASLRSNEKTDAMFKTIYIVEGAKRYLDAADPKAPLASPLYADLSGLPPILTFVSDDELLRDDSLRLHDRLLAAGVKSTLVRERGLIHVWPIFPGYFPEARKSVAQAADFIRTHTAKGETS